MALHVRLAQGVGCAHVTVRADRHHGFATRFNPLTEIRIGEPREVSDTQNLATIICDPDGKGLESGGTEGHFRRIAQAFLVGVILHVLYKERAKGRTATLSDLARTISNPSGTVEDLLMEMLHTAHTPAGPHDGRTGGDGDDEP